MDYFQKILILVLVLFAMVIAGIRIKNIYLSIINLEKQAKYYIIRFKWAKKNNKNYLLPEIIRQCTPILSRLRNSQFDELSDKQAISEILLRYILPYPALAIIDKNILNCLIRQILANEIYHQDLLQKFYDKYHQEFSEILFKTIYKGDDRHLVDTITGLLLPMSLKIAILEIRQDQSQIIKAKIQELQKTRDSKQDLCQQMSKVLKRQVSLNDIKKARNDLKILFRRKLDDDEYLEAVIVRDLIEQLDQK